MYKIVVDSCCDLPESLRSQPNFSVVPLSISLGDRVFVDNGGIDTLELLRDMRQNSSPPRTSCPSPGDFADAMSGEDDVFAITMSRHVSGTYQSALAGADIKQGSGRVHVFDSKSASAGQSLIFCKIAEYIREGEAFKDIIDKTEGFIASMNTFFVLQSLDNLIKNGRMNRLVGQVASILGMRPIMGADDGKIVLVEKARGTKNAMSRLADNILTKASLFKDSARDTLIIAQCNCLDRAQQLKADILAKGGSIKDVIIVKTGGLSTTYADDGGIIVAF